MDWLTDWLSVPNVITTCTAAFVVFVANSVRKYVKGASDDMKKWRSEHNQLVTDVSILTSDVESLGKDVGVLSRANKRQLKNTICHIYQVAIDRGEVMGKHNGIITMMELDNFNGLCDSYFEQGGNHYVHTLAKRTNEEFEIVGELPDGMEEMAI